MQLINVNELKPHEKNNFFFDDIQGDNWSEFKISIETSGVIEPIIITQEKVIVSGHQRVRACKELNIQEVPCEVKIYESDDKILKDLLETNLRQRGIGNTNPIKFGRCIQELEKIYGIKQGGDRKSNGNNSPLISQSGLAEQFNIDDKQLRNYKKLLTLIPELQSLIEDDKLSPTVGYKVLAKLTKEQQEELIKEFGKEFISSLTQKKAEELILNIKKDKENLENQLKNEQNKQKTNDNTINSLKTQLSTKDKDIEILKRDKNLLERKVKLNEEDAKKFNDLKTQIEFLNKEKEDIARQIQSATELSGLSVKIDNFLKTELSPIRYSRTLERMDSEVAVKNLQDIIESVESWCIDMRVYLPNKYNNKNIIDVEVIK